MTTETKVFRAQFKTVGEPDSMEYESLVSVFDNRDHAGDIVRPGAFADSLKTWAKSGLPIPSYYAHRMDDPMMCIGTITDVAEVLPGDKRLEDATGTAKTNGGLWTKTKLDADNPNAQQVWKLLKDGRLNQSSFTYEVKAGNLVFPQTDDNGDQDQPYYELNQLDLFEAGPCPLGCNDATQVLATKNRQAEMDLAAKKDVSTSQVRGTQVEEKAGRALSAKNETDLKSAVDLINGVLSSTGSADDAGKTEAGDSARKTRMAALLAAIEIEEIN